MIFSSLRIKSKSVWQTHLTAVLSHFKLFLVAICPFMTLYFETLQVLVTNCVDECNNLVLLHTCGEWSNRVYSLSLLGLTHHLWYYLWYFKYLLPIWIFSVDISSTGYTGGWIIDHLHASENVLITFLITVMSWLDARKNVVCNQWESDDQWD